MQKKANPIQLTSQKDKTIKEIVAQCANVGRKGTKDICNATVKHLYTFAKRPLKACDLNEKFIIGFSSYLLNDAKLAPSSVRTYLQKLHAIIELCIRQKYLDSNPMPPIGRLMPSVPRSSRTQLERSELCSLIGTQCRNNQVKIAFLFACFTGLRLSDIETLRWEHIVRSDGGWMIVKRQVKTGNAVRIPVENEVYEMLKKYCFNNKTTVFILPSRTTVSKTLNRWCAEAGIKKHVTFHVSRHTFASILINGRVELLTVSELCGHRSIETTKIYTHLNDSTRRNAIKIILQYVLTSPQKEKKKYVQKNRLGMFKSLKL